MKHKEKKSLEENNNDESDGISQISMLIPKGLSNLGNTCFFNSIMQCLSNTHSLIAYLNELDTLNTITNPYQYITKIYDTRVDVPALEIKLPGQRTAPILTHFSRFIAEFTCGKNPNPRSLFDQISRKVPRFRGWQQQDAHELLRYLLDELRNEEIVQTKRGFMQFCQSDNRPKEEKIMILNALLQGPAAPVLDAIFGGTLQQRVECSRCKHVSTCHEQFFDLSLPLLYNDCVTAIEPEVIEKQENGIKDKASKPKIKGRNNPSKQTQQQEPVKLSKHQKKKEMKQARKNKNKRKNLGKQRTVSINDDLLEKSLNENNSNGVEETAKDSRESADKCEENEVMQKAEEKRLNNPTPPSDQLSVINALKQFTDLELLDKSNAYKCEKCCNTQAKDTENGDSKENEEKPLVKFVEASKRYLVCKPPMVLTLHLKRFEQIYGALDHRRRVKKLSDFVAFDLIFDLMPFCSENVERILPGQDRILYSLYGVVCHSGGMSGGHYIAYVRSRPRLAHIDYFFHQARAFEPPAAENSEKSLSESLSLRLSLTENSAETLSLHLSEDANGGSGTPLEYPAQKSPEALHDFLCANSTWYRISDTSVSPVSEKQVLSAEAYILFYERIF